MCLVQKRGTWIHLDLIGGWSRNRHLTGDQLLDSKHIRKVKLWTSASRNGLPYMWWSGLIRTCRRVYLEASRVLYGQNRFFFENEQAWMNFVVFSQRLTVTSSQYLRQVTLCPNYMFEGPPPGELAVVRQKALTIANSLPNIQRLVFCTYTDISYSSRALIDQFCCALKDTQCALTFFKFPSLALVKTPYESCGRVEPHRSHRP